LKVKYHQPVSSIAFNCNLRPYGLVTMLIVLQAAGLEQYSSDVGVLLALVGRCWLTPGFHS